MFFFFQPKTLLRLWNPYRLKTRKSYTLKFIFIITILLFLACFSWDFYCCSCQPFYTGYLFNESMQCLTPNETPPIFTSDSLRSITMHEKQNRGRGHNVFCMDSLQQVISVQLNISERSILLCVFFLPLPERTIKLHLIHRVIWGDIYLEYIEILKMQK